MLARILKREFKLGRADIIEPSKQRRTNALFFGEIDNAYESFDASSHVYSLFVSSHSLEHVGDLEKTIYRIHDQVKVGGIVFFEVPNCDDHYFESTGYVDTHVNYFSANSFRRIGDAMGWQVLDVSEWGPRHGDRVESNQATYYKNEGGQFLRAIFERK